MKDVNRRTARRDSDASIETPDFIFNYSDSDSLNSELAEWYTYSEEPEFVWNAKAFKNTLYKENYGERKWSELTAQEKKSHITRLLNQTDVSNKQMRDDVYRSVLYLVQGVFQECDSIDDFNKNLVENVLILYECDAFNLFIDTLLFEVNNICSSFLIENKYAPCISDNTDLRVILSILYSLLEVIRCYDIEVAAKRLKSNTYQEEKFKKFKEHLTNELNKPLDKTNELLSVYLFQLISKFCNQNIIVLPIKKIILMLWKVLLFTLGGIEDAFRLKNELRLKFNLPCIAENPSLILSKMQPATPPPNPIDIVNELQFANPNASYKRKKNGLTKQTKGIDGGDEISFASNSNTNNNGIVSSLLPTIQDDIKITSDSLEDNNVFNDKLDEPIKLTTSTDEDFLMDDTNSNDDNLKVISEEESQNLFQSIQLLKTSSFESSELTSNSMEIDEQNKTNEMFGFNSNTESREENVSSNTPYPEINTPFIPRSQSPPSADKDENQQNSTIIDATTINNNISKAGTMLMDAANDSASIKLNIYNQIKTLPWRPKVKQSELESFLDQERKKFLGYGDLLNDLDTLVGLPYPIHESVKILKQHLFASLSEEQIKLEEKFHKYPMSTKEIDQTNDDSTLPPAEILFSSLLSNLPQYLICLLKILLTSVPQTRPKNDSLQIMSDLFPEDLSGSQFLTIKLGIDTNRHKEILIKAISAILLLLLKHFKVNHIYQFEFMSQHLLFANCVPLILKFFNLNVSSFIQSKNNHVNLDFPNCVIGMQPEIDADELENGDGTTVFRWRNVFSCINLLRTLNKLTKYKRSRVMMLVIFKSAPILKKILRIKQAMLQFYALKLLKMQTRHLGRQWRKTNMSTISAIYQKVRHRLNDDWAFGNEQEAQAWDFQSDECALRAKIDRYNQRKYKFNPSDTDANSSLLNDFLPLDNSLFSCLNTDVKLNDDFVNNYEQWLNDEVFSNKIDWDKLLIEEEDLNGDENNNSSSNKNRKCVILF